MVLGGSDVKVDVGGHGSVAGKSNIVPGEAFAIGDIRALSVEQLARVKDKKHSVVSKNLNGTKAEITFEDHYPPMTETPGNVAVYEELKAASRLLGSPDVGILDPLLRGAGDISFVSPYVDALSGLGANGSGAHAPGERVELDRLPIQSKRGALLIQRLIEKR
jgi:glutamate carboxypeptidase